MYKIMTLFFVIMVLILSGCSSQAENSNANSSENTNETSSNPTPESTSEPTLMK